MNSRPKGRLNISSVGLRFGSAKVASAVIRGALILAVVLSALLLIAIRPAQAQTETVLYNFTGGSDGGYPNSRLTSDGKGNFYGTTGSGGLGYGTVFELSPDSSGGWKETTLYSFTGGADGAWPVYSYVIFDSVGNLYGTASLGGNGYGVVFKLSPVGASWTETVLYSFCAQIWCMDGADPMNGLIMDAAGNLYGTTWQGIFGNGTVFELSPSGGGWKEQVIYTAETNASNPGLTMDAAGNIFGVSASTVFELSPNGQGGWNGNVIYTFNHPKLGSTPVGTPAVDQAGNLYGTTAFGGAKGYGTVYKLIPGTKEWKEKTLYSFKGGPKDGSRPWAGIVFDAAGNIYGTTDWGGKSAVGTVFELVPPIGTGKYYTEKVLWNFNITDGSEPEASLMLAGAGKLYGTTQFGGSSGNGVVFKVKMPVNSPISTSQGVR